MIICKDCGKEKKHQAKGLCKPCYDRRWYIARREEVLARMSHWRQENPDYNKSWYKSNPDYYCQYRKDNREKVNAHSCYWKQNNPEKVAATRRRYREANREEILAGLHRWQEANPDYYRRYQQENPDKVAAINARRRAHKKVVADSLTLEQIEFERKIGEATYPGEKLHMHHLVPLSRDGGHTWGNIVFIPVSLNLSIGDRLPEEVYEQLALNCC